MKELFVIRHAKTEWNLEGRFLGKTDLSLCDIGIEEAKSWNLPSDIDLVISSPLKRARETAAIIAKNAPIEIETRVREMDLGDWEGRFHKEIEASLDEKTILQDFMGVDYCPHNGESMRQVRVRVGSWLQDLSKRKEDRIIVVSHKNAITALYSLATNWDLLTKPKIRLFFPCLHIFNLDKDGLVQVSELNRSL
ncbi:MAG: histidine phosphatase family protein [Oligoflexia bacterium]|nr:histidine phosphatase family protein [Oligoflexia bacterium]